MSKPRVALVAVVALCATAAVSDLMPPAHGQGARTALARFESIVVEPVAADDVHNLVDAGTLDVDGYKDMVLNLGGDMKGAPTDAGAIGVFLVPDGHPFDKALEYEQVLPFAIRIEASVVAGRPSIFLAETKAARVAFSRYRVLLYNTTDSAATVVFYAYRTR